MEIYTDWEQKPNQTRQDLEDFVDKLLSDQIIQDDNFFVFIINGEYYRSNPPQLLGPMQVGSELYQQWTSTTQFSPEEWKSADTELGNILFKAEPLVVDDQQMGVMVLIHELAEEQNEALAIVTTFTFIEGVVVLISLLLAWFVVEWLLKPVQELAIAARQINESDHLTQRLTPKGSGELVDLAQTFNAMMDRLQESFNHQRRFVNDAGHELRTPITIVWGHLELMADDPQEQHETIELVLDELDRMGCLVNDMIALATAEHPDFLQYERIDLRQFIRDLFTKAQSLADRIWQVKLECSGSMMGDRQRLAGALLNLLRNAAQHTPPNGTIELGCKQTLTQVIFWIKDTGRGISLEDQQRIFDRFVRLGKRRSEGSGLGLAIVKAFTEAHRGKIDLVSQLGIGSTFTITLPLSAQNNTVV
ncbi:ATP-binding protein [Acaryochloris sp. IP29b_bin.137]|uniref:sensor histidine kinase n=1 Tax=Acaryochloris sp. IP29b_bin.137 TaxID=2969217 RepID=UPI00261B39A2|nr:ATP-binding protein [Acaryochloris sp. IP29b_bin.137]